MDYYVDHDGEWFPATLMNRSATSLFVFYFIGERKVETWIWAHSHRLRTPEQHAPHLLST